MVVSGGTSVTYSQPITVVAAESAPEEGIPEETVTKTELFMSESLENFKKGDYMVALEGVNKAIAESPGDGAFHEYRALVLFALGQYGEATGVLNPLLASSPGWDWSTMVQLYASPDTYTEQLRKLEEYAKANSDSAAAQFLLGYHYMVCTYLDQAAASFAKAAELEPADQVAAQMAELAAASTRSGDAPEGVDPDAAGESPEEEPSDEPMIEAPESVELEQILGSWKSQNGEEGLVTLSLSDQGEFVWRFEAEGGEPFEMKGDFNLAQENVLTLDASDSQMAGTVKLTEDGKMNFILAGGPPGDPGLVFEKG